MKLVKFNLEIVMPDCCVKMFIRMLDCMRWCSRVGASRNVAFKADGDGIFEGFNFKMNGEEIPENLEDWRKIDEGPEMHDRNYPNPFRSKETIHFHFDPS